MNKNAPHLLLELIEKKFTHYLRHEIKNNCFYYTGKINISDLSQFFQESASKIITFFWKHGITNLTESQNLSPALVNLYCQNKKLVTSIQRKISFNDIIEEYLTQIDQSSSLASRPPIISLMGHIDHGKTTLLDTILHSQLQREERGGITQTVSLHQVEFRGQKITFLDTPGHQIFLEMRQRGMNLTDLVILVVAADDGVMPQTKEIIKYIRQNQILALVFLNHKKPHLTDNESNITKIKNQLQEQGLNTTDWGGDTLIVSGNAKDRASVDYLLENILLLAESQGLKANFQRPANGIVLDSKLSSRMGITTDLLVQGGCLRPKDLVLIKGQIGKIKKMTDQTGTNFAQAYPSDPVQVIGLDFPTEAGEKFLVVNDEQLGKKITQKLSEYQSDLTSDYFSSSLDNLIEKGKKKINLMAMADSQTSLEALIKVIQEKSTADVDFQLVHASFGNLNDHLLNLAKITHSFLLIFNLGLDKNFYQKIKENQTKYFQSGIIYEIEEKLAKIVQQSKEKKQVEKILGKAEVKRVFSFSKVGSIAGCQVINGLINRNNPIYVWRQGEKIFTGKLKSLEIERVKANEVKKGQECGIVCEGFADFQEKDQIFSYCWEEADVI